MMLVLLLLGMLVFVMPAPVYATGSSFSLTGETYPVSLTKGQSFGLSGTIKSTVKIDRVTVGVYNEDTGSWVSGATVREYGLGTKSYDIGNADPYIKFGSLAPGDYTYRVWVKDTNGASKYLLKKAFTVKSASGSTGSSSGTSAGTGTFSVKGANYPATLTKGKSFSIQGKIVSAQKIKRVTVGVYNEDTGSWVSTAVHRVYNLGTKTYDISNADAYIKFGTLKAGHYTYRVWVKDVKGASKYVLKKAFTVKTASGSTGSSSGTSTSKSSFSITGANYPTALMKGESFSIKGKVKSTRKISRISIGVYNKSAGKWMDGAYVKKSSVGTKTYDVSKVNSKIKFGSLPAGSYVYRVWVKDVKGAKKYLLSKPFTVLRESKFTTSGITAPETLTEGGSFSLAGTVKSANKITKVRAGITDENGSWVKGAYVDLTPGTRIFDLESVDEDIKFGSLPAGSYRFRVKVTDAAGTTKRVVNKAFTVAEKPAQTAPSSVLLSYNASLIKSIGKQPYSGPCGLYSMAYARVVLDGAFPLGKYKTYEDKIISEYGHGSSYAYWGEAGGSMIVFSTVRSMYRRAFDQLAAGKPCIINCYNPKTGNNHFVLAIGYVKGTTRADVTLDSFIVLDPATGTKRIMAEAGYESPAKSPYGPELVVF